MSKRCIESGDDQEASLASEKTSIHKRKLTHDDYTVGWICPLEVEQIAAMEMLDAEHERLPQAPTDHNVYNLGSIAEHNVVIAGLHQPGNSPAATVVTQMRMTFRNLKFGLLVGIGGGVPVKTDNGIIRLGHVVVSKPTGRHSGAVQYDHGKARVGQFERTGALAPPPAVLLNAAQDLASKRARERIDRIDNNINRIDTSIRGLRKYKHPGEAKDHLYKADYIHSTPGLSCDECGCDPSMRVHRPTYDDDDNVDESYIAVHRGTIASGEAVIKDAKLRDELAEEYGLLCFEMEAAGALADFPCIVIRGISDYCDSHKNDQWHGYAAAAAAAYARQLFFHMPIDEVKRYITETAVEDIHHVRRRQDDQDYQKLLEWLSPTDFPAQQRDILSRRQEGTAQWFLDSMEFNNWLQRPDKTLFCPGIPGAGKTMIAAVAISHLYGTTHSNDVGIAYLFCSYKAQVDHTAQNLLAALLKQLVQGRPDIAAPVTNLYYHHLQRQTKPSLDELTQALLSTCSSYSTVYIVVDALDECPSRDGVRCQLIGRLRSLQASRNVRLLFTSRKIPEVTEDFQSTPLLEVCASEEDVKRYVAGQVSRLPKCIQRDERLKNDVQNKIVEAVDGMFLLARLHVDSLLDQTSRKKVLAKLAKLQKGSDALSHAYKDALDRIDGQLPGYRDLARRVLSWITYAQRPLTTNELRHALAIEPGEGALDYDNMDEIEDIVSVCAGLVTVDDESGIIRLVHYTTQEYFERVRLEWNPMAQEDIAMACLTYLSFDAFKSGSCPSDESLDQRHAEHQFLDYSARYWSEHIRPVQDSSISELALAFLLSDTLVDSVIQVVSVPRYIYKYEGIYMSFPARTKGLHLTSMYGLLNLTKWLLASRDEERDIQADPEDSNHRRPLSYAAEYGQVEVAKLLLGSGASVNAQAGGYGSALQAASRGGHESVVKLLLGSGASVNAQGGVYGGSALYEASDGGHEAVVKLLLGSGASVNAQGGGFGSALQAASRGGHEAVVKLLVEAGATW